MGRGGVGRSVGGDHDRLHLAWAILCWHTQVLRTSPAWGSRDFFCAFATCWTSQPWRLPRIHTITDPPSPPEQPGNRSAPSVHSAVPRSGLAATPRPFRGVLPAKKAEEMTGSKRRADPGTHLGLEQAFGAGAAAIAFLARVSLGHGEYVLNPVNSKPIYVLRIQRGKSPLQIE